MDDITATAIMQRFGKAYFKRDRALLAEVLCEDAQWHFAFGTDAPDGRVRKGVDGFLRGIEENDALFERLRFTDVKCFGLDAERIVMTYLVEGKYRDGEAFSPARHRAGERARWPHCEEGCVLEAVPRLGDLEDQTRS